MYLDDNNQYAGMSSWLLQYKNRIKVASGALSSIVAHHESIGLDTKHPYVATCFHFGVEREASALATMATKQNLSVSRALRIEVKGLSENVFPLLKTRRIADSIITVKNATKEMPLPEQSGDEILAHDQFWVGSSSEHIKWGLKRKIGEIS
jgi:hypothetical protein